MTVKDFKNEQFVFCTKHNNHPKEDLEFCQECESNGKCQAYQEYIQPSLPWIKASEKAAENDQIERIVPGETTAICRRCRHYHGNTRCEAYPDKIPTEILLGYVSHTRPYKGISEYSLSQLSKRKNRETLKFLILAKISLILSALLFLF